MLTPHIQSTNTTHILAIPKAPPMNSLAKNGEPLNPRPKISRLRGRCAIKPRSPSASLYSIPYVLHTRTRYTRERNYGVAPNYAPPSRAPLVVVGGCCIPAGA